MNLEKEISEIKERNARVEAEKAWETSIFRKILISFFTYVITASAFYLIGVDSYLQNAFIPTIGYFMSVQSLPFIKEWWIERRFRRHK